MAQRLTTYDFSKPSNITTQDRMSYPWDQWFDGSIWRIVQGEDFKTHPLMMERIIRTRATARKAKIIIRHEGDPFGAIVFRRTDVPEPTWVVAPTPAPTTTNEEFALVDGQSHTPVTRSKRPVRPS